MQNGKSHNAQPFSEHLKELRLRLIYSIGALFLGCGVGFTIHEKLFSLIRRPLHSELYYTTPTGGFNAIIRVSLLFGIIVAVPIFIYQIGKFLSPAFKHRIRAFRIILSSTVLAFLGVLFAYYVSLPAALNFLANIDSKDLQSLITVNEYLSFVFGYVVGFAILFQLPLILLFINRIKPQKPGRLMRYQRWVILISFIVAAILTPTPDPINQTIMALPIIMLYQVSVVLIWFANRRRKRIAVESATEVPMVSEQAVSPEPALEPELVAAQEPAVTPAAYGMAEYSTPAPFASNQPQVDINAPTSDPRLIMDIFPVSQNPAI